MQQAIGRRSNICRKPKTAQKQVLLTDWKKVKLKQRTYNEDI